MTETDNINSNEFSLGAEMGIGISTQEFHARGPMGLNRDQAGSVSFTRMEGG